MAKGLIRSAFIGKNIFTQYINKGDGSKQKNTAENISHNFPIQHKTTRHALSHCTLKSTLV